MFISIGQDWETVREVIWYTRATL